MSRSRKRRATGRRLAWHDDWMQLMAWKDYCCTNEEDFDTTVLAHLRDTTERIFTLVQINDKLRGLHKKYGKKNSDIHSEGTASLSGLSAEARDKIAARVSQINLDRDRIRLYSLDNIASPRCPSAASVSSISVTFLSSTPSFDAPPDYLSSNRRTETIQGSESVADASGEDCQAERPQRAGESALPTSARSRVTPAESCDLVPESQPSSDSPMPCHPDDPRLLPGADILRDELVQTLEGRLEEGRALAARQDARIKAQKSRILSLEMELSKLRTEHEILMRCERADDEQEQDAEQLVRLQKTNSHQEAWIKMLEAAQKDLDMLEKGELVLRDSEISTRLVQIENKIANACFSLGEWGSLVGHPRLEPSQSSYLESLVYRVSRMGIHQFLGFLADEGVEKLGFLQSIVAASLCYSAFESEFPDFVGQDALLDKYRELVLARGGVDTLRQLDRLAHKSLISDGCFEAEVVSAEVQRIMVLISDALEPFLGPGYPATSGGTAKLDGDAVPGAGLEPDLIIVVPIAESFPEIFEAALKLKLQLFLPLRQEQYQFFFPRPGDAFNPVTMKDSQRPDDYANQGRRGRSAAQNEAGASNKEVKLCVFPGLYAYDHGPAEDSAKRMDVRDAVVTYRNFSIDKLPSSMPGHRVVTKAVVIASEQGNKWALRSSNLTAFTGQAKAQG